MTEQNLEFQEKCYEHIIHARNFHYEQMSRWTSYFYLIIGALFVGYYQVKEASSLFLWVIVALGYLASVCNFLSLKGYIYWWNHWSQMLIDYEKKHKMDVKDNGVYSVFANIDALDCPMHINSGSNISTSKVALFFANCVVLGWSFLIAVQVTNLLFCNCCACCQFCCGKFIITTGVIIFVLWALGVLIMPLFPCLQSKMYHKNFKIEFNDEN